ncbi:MAG: hypothetical protein KJ901_03050, partial [Gammaproteobacteria bacterium]|nr:hypothetical protein [Gammaproteobacteria bacterium]MBU1442053.1 hypothetical protein [Gammaproteobacteria bacterium]
PIGLLGGMNRKTALENNPLMFSDPMGLDAWGSYGYGRYLPATNPDPSFWEWLNFPETPAQRAAGENIALGFCGSTLGSGATKAFSKGKQALVDMAKADRKAGVTRSDMRAYEELNRMLPDPFPANKVRLDEGHVGGAPHSQVPHGHVGPVDHIPIRNPCSMNVMQERLSRAAGELGLRVSIAYVARLPNGRLASAQALFPDLGGVLGTLIFSSENALEGTLREELKAHGFSISTFSEPLPNEDFDIENYAEMFSDWGWTREVELKPRWMRG